MYMCTSIIPSIQILMNNKKYGPKFLRIVKIFSNFSENNNWTLLTSYYIFIMTIAFLITMILLSIIIIVIVTTTTIFYYYHHNYYYRYWCYNYYSAYFLSRITLFVCHYYHDRYYLISLHHIMSHYVTSQAFSFALDISKSSPEIVLGILCFWRALLGFSLGKECSLYAKNLISMSLWSMWIVFSKRQMIRCDAV